MAPVLLLLRKINSCRAATCRVGFTEERKLVVGGFTKSDVPVDGKYKTVSAHAYTVSLPVDDTMLFVMRNPWGAVPTD